MNLKIKDERSWLVDDESFNRNQKLDSDIDAPFRIESPQKRLNVIHDQIILERPEDDSTLLKESSNAYDSNRLLKDSGADGMNLLKASSITRPEDESMLLKASGISLNTTNLVNNPLLAEDDLESVLSLQPEKLELKNLK